jgi:hypothetical protein
MFGIYLISKSASQKHSEACQQVKAVVDIAGFVSIGEVLILFSEEIGLRW